MVDNVVSLLIEGAAQKLFGDSHADRISNALTQWSGGYFDAGCITSFRVARCLRLELSKLFKVIERYIVAGKIEQGIMQHGGMTIREDEAVAIRPIRIFGIEI